MPGALRTAEGIPDDYGRGKALKGIAVAQAQAGDVPGALRTAEAIPDESIRIRSLALRGIAEAQV